MGLTDRHVEAVRKGARVSRGLSTRNQHPRLLSFRSPTSSLSLSLPLCSLRLSLPSLAPSFFLSFFLFFLLLPLLSLHDFVDSNFSISKLKIANIFRSMVLLRRRMFSKSFVRFYLFTTHVYFLNPLPLIHGHQSGQLHFFIKFQRQSTRSMHSTIYA